MNNKNNDGESGHKTQREDGAYLEQVDLKKADLNREVVSLTDFIDQLERRAFIRSLDGRQSAAWDAIKESLSLES